MLTKLFRNYLLVTNTVVSIGISATGDIIQQKYEQHRTVIQENTVAEKRFPTTKLAYSSFSSSFELIVINMFLCHLGIGILNERGI